MKKEIALVHGSIESPKLAKNILNTNKFKRETARDGNSNTKRFAKKIWH